LEQLPARDPEINLINVPVDTPKSSRNKYKYDERSHVWRLNKILPLGASFPFDFGFIPGTRGEDGDPIDVLVVTEQPAFAGCVLPTLLIGVLEAEQTENGKKPRNDPLIGVVQTRFNPPIARSLEELGEQRLLEIEHFFTSYNQMEGREFKAIGRGSAKHAQQIVDNAI
jgi:inorganic pyrophosphatase